MTIAIRPKDCCARCAWWEQNRPEHWKGDAYGRCGLEAALTTFYKNPPCDEYERDETPDTIEIRNDN